MSDNDFTAAMLAKAERRAPMNAPNGLQRANNAVSRADFMVGASSARTYLEAQEPTDAECRAVAESYEPGLFSLSDHEYSIKFDNPAKYRATHQGLSIADARAALAAARNARMGR